MARFLSAPRPCGWVPCTETVIPNRVFCPTHLPLRRKALRVKLESIRAQEGLCIRGCGNNADGTSSLCRACKDKDADYHNRKRRESHPQTRLYRCSECGERGHNQRTCPKNPDR